MPELPEVETIRKGLAKVLPGRKINEVEILAPKIIKKPSVPVFRRKLLGSRFTDIRRRGKYLVFDLDPAGCLMVHLKLSGRLIYLPARRVPPEKYLLALSLSNGSRLYYQDIRRFGGFSLFEKDPLPDLKLGPEPLSREFTPEYWRKILAGRKTRVKPFLLDQKFVAGLGNIYVSEALFRARIHPDRPVYSLSAKEQARLYEAIQSVIREALACGGTSIQDYVKADGTNGSFQERLFVYRRKGEPCLVCKRPISVKKDGSRSTYFCSRCQK